MFTIGFEAGFGEVRGLYSEGVFIQRYFTVDVGCAHRVIGLDLDVLVSREVVL